MDSLCHPCITTIHLSYSFLSLKLPPPACAVLLIDYCSTQLPHKQRLPIFWMASYWFIGNTQKYATLSVLSLSCVCCPVAPLSVPLLQGLVPARPPLFLSVASYDRVDTPISLQYYHKLVTAVARSKILQESGARRHPTEP